MGEKIKIISLKYVSAVIMFSVVVVIGVLALGFLLIITSWSFLKDPTLLGGITPISIGVLLHFFIKRIKEDFKTF